VTGTSSLQGSAADATQQHKCACALHTEHPSHSIAGPRQQQGKQGAPGLQHTSRLRLYCLHKRNKALNKTASSYGSLRYDNSYQQSPTLPEQPQQSAVGK